MESITPSSSIFAREHVHRPAAIPSGFSIRLRIGGIESFNRVRRPLDTPAWVYKLSQSLIIADHTVYFWIMRNMVYECRLKVRGRFAVVMRPGSSSLARMQLQSLQFEVMRCTDWSRCINCLLGKFPISVAALLTPRSSVARRERTSKHVGDARVLACRVCNRCMSSRTVRLRLCDKMTEFRHLSRHALQAMN